MEELRNKFLAIKKGDQKALEAVFRSFYQELFFFAYQFIGESDIAEEVVQDVFIQIWEKKESLDIQTSPKSYLYTAVRNRSLNYLKSKLAKIRSETEVSLDLVSDSSSEPADQKLSEEELILLIQKGVQSLPEKCRIIFKLSRDSGMTYDEIANELGVTKETVKSQIKIALVKLRQFLGKYWDIVGLIITWMLIKNIFFLSSFPLP
ncbi:MAG: RNA polymerase sigma-70 factor [Bacteroidia bacterium]